MLYLSNDASTIHNGYGLFLTGDELAEVRDLFSDVPCQSSPFSLEFSVTQFDDVIDILTDYEVSSESKLLQKKLDTRKPPIMQLVENPVMPKFKLKPHNYQLEAIKYGITKERFLLGDEMGLGKSGTMVFLAEILKAHYEFKHTLIVCGVNGAKHNWHQVEIPKFSYESSHIIGSRVTRNGRVVVGDIKQRIEDIQLDHDEFYLIINIESLRDEDIVKALKSKIVSGDIGMVIIDEVHKASGRTSSQGKAIHELRTRFRVGLTGTPIYNAPFDIYNIMRWLGYEYKRFDEFRLEYAVEVPKTMTVKGKMIRFFDYVYKDLAMLHSKLKTFMLRRTVEVLKLPTPVFKDEYVELDKLQQNLYNKIKEETLKANSYQSLFTTDEVVGGGSSVFMNARRAISCPHTFGVKSDAKYERTVEIVDEALSNGRSVVIFAWFNDTIDEYYSKLSALYGDSVIAVQQRTKNTQDLITQFQTGDKPMVLIGSIGKLGTAFTVTRADIVIFIDKHVIWSDYKQAYMRVWRQGQTKTVFITNIMAKDTVDERLDFLLAKGRSHGDQVVDGIQPTEIIQARYSLEELL